MALPSVFQMIWSLRVPRRISWMLGPPPAKRMKSSAVSPGLRLADWEAKVLATVRSAVGELGLATVVRVAGGWVRDKLLGRSPHDLDLVVDDVKAEEFCGKVAEWVRKRKEPTDSVSKVAVIQENPDKGKQVETATFCLLGHWVDVTRLLGLDGAVGTPESDAKRRDFTVNALFYNVLSEEVEDFTGLGLRDMENKLIRTPLKAEETFMHDPLRLLRALRFSQSLGFLIHEDIHQSTKVAAVVEKLKGVSRERFGLEIGKMLSAPGNFAESFQTLCKWNLEDIVFELPKESAESLSKSKDVSLSCIQKLYDLTDEKSGWIGDRENLPMMILAAFLYPVANKSYKIKKKSSLLVEYIMKESLRLSNKETDLVVALHKYTEESLVILSYESFDDQRLQIGKFLRTVGVHWESTVLFSICTAASSLLDSFTSFCAWVKSSGLVGVWEWKPLLNGNEIQSQFKVKGPKIKEIIDYQIELQISNPSISKEECTAILEKKFCQ